MNDALLRKVGDWIDAYPQSYLQAVYLAEMEECGTVACIAGWALLFSDNYTPNDSCTLFLDKEENIVNEREAAQEELGLDPLTAGDLFRTTWKPAEGMSVKDALYALADGAPIEDITGDSK